MAYSNLSEFISDLEHNNELIRIKAFADPVLEIPEITDRISKHNGKALLFENNGTEFPLLINAFGSDTRMAMAIGRKDLDDAGSELLSLFNRLTSRPENIIAKISSLPELIKISGFMPSYTKGRGACQKVILKDPDLSVLPVLKCWPWDGGKYITLPMVHTRHPETGKTNVGMYRMQILDKYTTAMHWQRHKTGAGHFNAWKESRKKMPVSVALGGDPVYTYCSTAPLPENIDEYILAGFLRKKRVKLVKCITNDLYVPSDADIILEGFVDPMEELVLEGPFGDHTGFYSLSDWYPKFHVTCITHSERAVYPATIVGIPPMEDKWLIKATERIFLAPVKLMLLPEVEDLHMPDAGVSHNLVIVKIRKLYPGQGKKVINSLFGAGQMMFTKYLIVVSGDIDIRDYEKLLWHLASNVGNNSDLIFTTGPLDVLDHSSERSSVGGKLGIDGTIKMEEELNPYSTKNSIMGSQMKNASFTEPDKTSRKGFPVWIYHSQVEGGSDIKDKIIEEIKNTSAKDRPRLVILTDHGIEKNDFFKASWYALGNSDPVRDIKFIYENTILLDGTIKAFREGGFPRRWPNVVCSDNNSICMVDNRWNSLNLGPFIPSPSLSASKLLQKGGAEIITDDL